MDHPLLVHSATKLDHAAGRVVICGSHGGRYAGQLAVAAGVRAIVLNDAGIGLGNAGIAGLGVCEDAGLAAVALGHMSCRVGNAESAAREGVVSHANAQAVVLGVRAGQSARDATALLVRASAPLPRPMEEAEHRSERDVAGLRVVVMDSHGLVHPGHDDGAILVTASHGGLVGDDPASAGRAAARLFAFNDAGIGKDRAGIGRLPALDARATAAVTVGHETARIGDGTSTFETGIITHVNETARVAGARPGQRLRDLIEDLSKTASAAQ